MSLAEIMPSQMMINDFHLKIYHHGTLVMDHHWWYSISLMVQFILKRGNTFENSVISRDIHFREMILSFLMMMTSFSGTAGNWLELDWWLHYFWNISAETDQPMNWLYESKKLSPSPLGRAKLPNGLYADEYYYENYKK